MVVGPVAQSYIIPKDELTVDQIKALKEAALADLRGAISAVGRLPADYNIMDLQPARDLGETNDRWDHTYAAADTPETYISHALEDKEFVTFYGVAVLSTDPSTYRMDFSTPAEKRASFNLEKLYAQKDVIGYFREPISFAGGETVTVEITGRRTGLERLPLKGFIAVPKGTYLGKP